MRAGLTAEMFARLLARLDPDTTTPNISLTGVVPAANGGTGLSSAGALGNLLKSNGSAWTSAALSASDLPAGSGNYIQNATSQQASSNFNISGNGKANIFDAATQFNLNGSRVLSTNTASSNLFVGVGAGASNTTGGGNAFFGDSAGNANTTAIRGSFFGASAGLSNTTGGSNSFFGVEAGKLNTTGAFNSFFGDGAGVSNTTANNNSFFGFHSGLLNTTGANNSFFGMGAGASNTSAGGNSFFGVGAGFRNTTGKDLVFFGQRSGQNNLTGNSNAFFGGDSGSSNTTGNNNSFIGFQAGFLNTTGGNNVFVGPNAGSANVMGNSVTVIGANANVTANNLDHATAPRQVEVTAKIIATQPQGKAYTLDLTRPGTIYKLAADVDYNRIDVHTLKGNRTMAELLKKAGKSFSGELRIGMTGDIHNLIVGQHRLSRGGLNYHCEGLVCVCNSDDDCNDLFTSGVCGPIGMCVERQGKLISCSCLSF